MVGFADFVVVRLDKTAGFRGFGMKRVKKKKGG